MNSKFMAVKGIKIHCYESGDSKKPALILLHGLHGNASSILDIAEFLSENFYVICVDLPGYGHSHDIRGQFNFPNIAKLLVAFIEKMGIKKYYISGVSMGGSIAIEMGKIDQKKVKGFILLAPMLSSKHINVHYANANKAFMAIKIFNHPIIVKTLLPLVANSDFLLTHIVKIIMSTNMLTPEKIKITMQSMRSSTPASYVYSLRSVFEYNALDTPAYFSQPTVILLNPHDSSIDNKKTWQLAQKIFPKAIRISLTIESHNPAHKPSAHKIKKEYPRLLGQIKAAFHL